MPKHTPGPWFYGGSCISGPKHVIVARACHSWDGDRPEPKDYDRCAPRDLEEHRANAQLIAAAPDLLQACRDALNNFYGEQYQSPRDRVVLDRLRDAIARATE